MESTTRCPFILSLITLMLASGVVMPVVSMDLVDGTLGRSVHFIIPVALPSQYRIDWNCGHAGKVIVIARLTHGGSPQYNPIYGGRSEMLGNGTLRLDNISSEDVGTYKVKVFNPETFTSYIHRYQLNVYATLTAPVLRSIDANRLIISGTDMTLHCDAGDQTVTTYTFYRGQKMICSEPHVTCRGSSLDITPISEDDSGSYTCHIENPVSSYTSDPIPVTVSAPVSAVTLSSNASSAELWAGKDSVSLHCSAQGSAIAFSWSLDGKPVSSKPPYYITESDSPPYSSLTISPVSRNDIGPFTCTASNLLNSETSNELNLSLNWSPERYIACIVEGHDSMLQFDCSWPGGQPAANVTMIFNDKAEGTGLNAVTRNVALGQIGQRTNLTCIGNHYGKKFSCGLIFGSERSPQGKNNAVTEGKKANLETEALP